MPIVLTADTDARRLVATVSGEIALEEVRGFVASARTGDRRDWPLLFDATRASTRMSAAQVRALSHQTGATARLEGPRARVALIASDDELYGVMRMYQIVAENEGVVDTIGVFRTRAEGEAWLGW